MTECEHKFVLKQNDSFYKKYRNSNTFYSIDYFFCEKCLQEQSTQKSESVNVGQDGPLWTKCITKSIYSDTY